MRLLKLTFLLWGMGIGSFLVTILIEISRHEYGIAGIVTVWLIVLVAYVAMKVRR